MSVPPKSYPLPKHTLPGGISLENHQADLIEFQQFLEQQGIKTGNTRIARYIQYYDGIFTNRTIDPANIYKNAQDPRFQSQTDWHLYTLREVHELMWIWKGLKKHVPKGAIDKLKLCISGTDFAALDTNSLARNTLFELRIASYFAQSGCKVDMSTDTDIIVKYKKNTFYIECKRIGSLNKLHTHLTKAKQQLQKHMAPLRTKKRAHSLIVLDVTKVAYSHNGLVWGNTPDHIRDLLQNKLKDISTQLPDNEIFNKSPKLNQCWLQIHISALIMHPWAEGSRFSSVYILNPVLDRAGKKTAMVIHKLREKATKLDPRAIKPRKLTPRKETLIPNGTEYYFDDDIFQLFIKDRENIADLADDMVIADITLKGVKYQFTIYDLKHVTPSMIEGTRPQHTVDPNRAKLEYNLHMFGLKYPFLEDTGEVPSESFT